MWLRSRTTYVQVWTKHLYFPCLNLFTFHIFHPHDQVLRLQSAPGSRLMEGGPHLPDHRTGVWTSITILISPIYGYGTGDLLLIVFVYDDLVTSRLAPGGSKSGRKIHLVHTSFSPHSRPHELSSPSSPGHRGLRPSGVRPQVKEGHQRQVGRGAQKCE